MTAVLLCGVLPLHLLVQWLTVPQAAAQSVAPKMKHSQQHKEENVVNKQLFVFLSSHVTMCLY